MSVNASKFSISTSNMNPVYLDCAATTPMDPQVADIVARYMTLEYGNSGSRTHEYGARAKAAVQRARRQVASMAEIAEQDVIFTSGATESNNLAILGLANFLASNPGGHVITGKIEHKAVLEPMDQLARRGLEITFLDPGPKGFIEPDSLANVLRPETRLVSLMHVNNETGAIQPLSDYCEVLRGHAAFLHVDAAQGFGKILPDLTNPRIDMISASGHKMGGPKGIGALLLRRRDFKTPPLSPLMYGGGQERGLRPGTLPVPLVAGIGTACALALKNNQARRNRCSMIREEALRHLVPIGGVIAVPLENSIESIINISFPGRDSEALMLALKPLVAVSNGSACTSHTYTPSHVLTAMKFAPDRRDGALRFSWSYLTPEVPWAKVAETLRKL